MKSAKERVCMCLILGPKEAKRGTYVKLKTVSPGSQRVIWFDDLNDPRPGGHAIPEGEEGGVVTTNNTPFCYTWVLFQTLNDVVKDKSTP
jgi:hypothetical protein